MRACNQNRSELIQEFIQLLSFDVGPVHYLLEVVSSSEIWTQPGIDKTSKHEKCHWQKIYKGQRNKDYIANYAAHTVLNVHPIKHRKRSTGNELNLSFHFLSKSFQAIHFLLAGVKLRRRGRSRESRLSYPLQAVTSNNTDRLRIQHPKLTSHYILACGTCMNEVCIDQREMQLINYISRSLRVMK